MNDHAHDDYDALQWALNLLRKHSPQGGYDQLDRNRLFRLEQLRDQAQREARGG